MKLSEEHHHDCLTRHGYPLECNCHVDEIAQLEAELEVLTRIGEDKVILNEQVHALEAEIVLRHAEEKRWQGMLARRKAENEMLRKLIHYGVDPCNLDAEHRSIYDALAEEE